MPHPRAADAVDRGGGEEGERAKIQNCRLYHLDWEPQLPSSIEGPGRCAQTGSFGRPSPHGGASFKHSMSTRTHTLARDSGLCAPGPAGSFPRRGPRWQLRPARGAYSQSVLRTFPYLVWSFVSVPTIADARVYLPSTSSRPNSQARGAESL